MTGSVPLVRKSGNNLKTSIVRKLAIALFVVGLKRQIGMLQPAILQSMDTQKVMGILDKPLPLWSAIGLGP